MKTNNFVRMILMFDLPSITNKEKKIYRKFVKELIENGFIRIQYSIYSKLCINHDSVNTMAKRVKQFAPDDGNIRYLIITEKQYTNIVNINDTYSLQEQIETIDRTTIIGNMNDENTKR